ncbi:MAG: FecR family protein [Chitinophaga sp.]|uniref:FecR family protein n=1 Tax=Chitinophaga sp. TaxID=1869181 RepID=UPI001B04671F|nr:FecR family protein [Chitinophaga sp.]MBO9727982.1 FecR family protein [Chitinophaga sp.]
MTIHERLVYLVHQVEKQAATPEELQELCDLLLEDNTGALAARVEQLLAAPVAPVNDTINWELLANNILQADRPKVVRMRPWTRVAAAAAILLLLGVGGYFFLQHQAAPPAKVVAAKTPADILPGGNKAMLTLGDGSVISLDSAANGTLAQQGNTAVIKSAGGQLLYRSSNHNTANTAALFNKIATPRGGQYQLTLPDSTRVWLNAASSLRYPAAFTGNNRTVQLTGEAYFEVAKNAAQPFIVQVDQMEVQVLGTHFNIMAYDDEAQINTTLLEGAVKVNNGHYNQKLSPGEGAHLNRSTGLIKVLKEADAADAIAWKNGFIQLEGNDLPAVMRQIARWYNVEVIYKKEVPAHFRGIIPRNVPISQVLKMMELTGEVHFDIREHQIIVSP